MKQSPEEPGVTTPAVLEVVVVIVSYRSAALTLDALRSLVVERSDPGLCLRAVVVDNASGDTPSIAAGIEAEGWGYWVRLVEAPRNGGFAYGNNLGIAHACEFGVPDFFHLLNPDTRILPGAVRQLVDFLRAHAHVGIAGSSFSNDDGSDWPIAFRFPSLWSELEGTACFGPLSRLLSRWVVARRMERRPARIDWCAGASMMVRCELLRAIGGMDEQFFLYYEETEFCWRAARAGYETWYVPASRVVHIAGQSTKVTERGVVPKRLPGYMFESRRRYFQLTRGPGAAFLADLAATAGALLNHMKVMLMMRSQSGIPNYLPDLWSYSVLHERNRACPVRSTRIPVEQDPSRPWPV